MMPRPLTVAPIALALAAWSLSVVTTRTQGRAPTGLAVEYVSGMETVGGEALLRLRPGTPPAVVADLQRAVDAESVMQLGTGAWLRLRSTTRTTQTLLDVLGAHAAVDRVEPNYIVHSTAVPNDPQFPSLWGLLNTTTPNADVHAVSAWDVSTGASGPTAPVIGVIDSGVDYNHPDLAANMWSAPAQFTITIGTRSLTCPAGSHGFNAIAFSQMNNVAACNPMDDNNHGTHTAGTVGAVGNNGTGVVGVNWNARIMALKFLDSGGSGSVGDAVNAMEFAIKTRAAFAGSNAANVRVLSNSWGGYGPSQMLFDEIVKTDAADILFVAAAGNNTNNNDSVPFYPASYDVSNIIAVAATHINDGLAAFSNYGHTTVDLGAPGDGIVSTIIGGGYASASGTSMAAPFVSGTANLLLSKCTLTTPQLKQAILANVDLIPGLNGVTITGGRLNADRAIRSCAPPPSGGTTVTFNGTDTTTQGSWRNVYGADGYDVIGNSTSYPSYATVAVSGQQAYTWAASTSDVRALQKASGADRLAATWYSGTNFTIDLNITDGQSHQIALYLLDWDTTSRVEMLEVRDATTNAVLDTRTASGFNGGQYFKWKVNGHVTIRVTRSLGNNAVVSGLFFDTVGNTPPDVSLTQPTDNAIFSPAPATITLAANASDADGIDRVEFYSDTAGLIGTSTTAPYGGTWSNVGVGSYVLTAKAFDTLGTSRVSAPVHVTVTAGGGAGTTATFLGKDTTTQGTWRGAYGSDGYNVVGDAVSYPSYAAVSVTGQQSYTWLSSTADVRALQKAVGSDRLAATWYAGASFTIDVNLTDGQAHQVALYLLDWDTTARVQTVEVRDAATSAVLDSRSASGFNGGHYLKWTLTGHVSIVVTRVAGNNAVASGLFFDPAGNAPPDVTMTAPADGAIISPAPADIALGATATDADGIHHVEFYSGATLIGSTSTFPYGGTWSGVGAGSYTLTAKAFDNLLNARVSAPVHITVTAGGNGTASFLGADNATQGSWRNVYGTDGYEVIGVGAAYPSYAVVTPTGHQSYTWTATTSDVRGLQKPANPSDRLAATWYAAASFTIDVNVIDAQPHQLALYFLDWDSFDRAQTVEIRDASSNVLLDTRTVSGFHGGRYLKWSVSGHVKIQVIRTGALNAVVSGVFFNP